MAFPDLLRKQPSSGRIVAGVEGETLRPLLLKHADRLPWAVVPSASPRTVPLHCHCQAGGRKSNQLRLYLKKIGAGPEKWGLSKKHKNKTSGPLFLSQTGGELGADGADLYAS